MPFKSADMRSCHSVPQADSSVPTPTCDGATIGTERYAANGAKQCYFLIGVRIIEPNPDTTSHRKASPVRGILYVKYTPFTETGFGTFGQPPLRVILGESVERR